MIAIASCGKEKFWPLKLLLSSETVPEALSNPEEDAPRHEPCGKEKTEQREEKLPFVERYTNHGILEHLETVVVHSVGRMAAKMKI